MTAIPPYPLHWPEGYPRTAPNRRDSSRFKTTLAGAINNVKDSLRLFGDDSGRRVSNVVATTNIGGINLGDGRSADPGVAVWFEWDGALRCIAVDRYPKPEDNLQAIHHILEARRTEVRHGGLVIAQSAFKGFLALPSPTGSHWSDVLGVSRNATKTQIEEAWKEKARAAHPDRGGSADEMAKINAARDRALSEAA